MHGPSKFEIVIGADIQDEIGSYDENSCPERVGSYADGPRGQKGEMAFRFLIEKNEIFRPQHFDATDFGKFNTLGCP